MHVSTTVCVHACMHIYACLYACKNVQAPRANIAAKRPACTTGKIRWRCLAGSLPKLREHARHVDPECACIFFISMTHSCNICCNDCSMYHRMNALDDSSGFPASQARHAPPRLFQPGEPLAQPLRAGRCFLNLRGLRGNLMRCGLAPKPWTSKTDKHYRK